jgi:hypothetical protein
VAFGPGGDAEQQRDPGGRRRRLAAGELFVEGYYRPIYVSEAYEQ